MKIQQPAKPTKTAVGRMGETIAIRYLLGRGYQLLARNYRYGTGEIDAICDYYGETVFVEVKYRSYETEYTGLQAVTKPKRRRIIHAAKHFMALHGRTKYPYRFDIITIIREGEGLQLTHYRWAFDREANLLIE